MGPTPERYASPPWTRTGRRSGRNGSAGNCGISSLSSRTRSSAPTSSPSAAPSARRAGARKPEHAEVDPGREEDRHEDRREPRETQERGAAKLGRGRPDDRRELYEAADPERRGREVQPVRKHREARRPGVGGGVTRERQPG